MEIFHFLADHRADINRSVKVTPTGVETLAESDDPDVAEALRSHVVAMSARIAAGNPVHRRDPLFAELFAHADKIKVTHESTARGIRVIETSDDPYVVKLIQAHADVVTLFIQNGRSEMMRNHDVPAR